MVDKKSLLQINIPRAEWAAHDPTDAHRLVGGGVGRLNVGVKAPTSKGLSPRPERGLQRETNYERKRTDSRWNILMARKRAAEA